MSKPKCGKCGSTNIGYDAWVDADGKVIGGPFDAHQCQDCGDDGIMDEPDPEPAPWPGVRFDCSHEDHDIIIKIVKRAARMGLVKNDMGKMMDITACHVSGNPLKLQLFLDGKEGDFLHDIMGIEQHLDRTTGKLGDGFLPRFSKPRTED